MVPLKAKNPCFYLLSLFFIPALFADYPFIQETAAWKDPVFRQQQSETEDWYFNHARGLSLPPHNMYCYKSRSEDSLIALAAAFSLPVDTLATVNGFENISDFVPGQNLLIPSAPGLYLRDSSQSSWMTALRRKVQDKPSLPLLLEEDGKKLSVSCYPGLKLPPELKTRFILPLFLSPLSHRYITSPYGYRSHPVTGLWSLHTGTDYRSPAGNPVFASRDGKVLSAGELEDYGKFVILAHKNGYTTMYGHLSRILVKKGEFVSEGTVIAQSGNTGISTGPHLHFEIRQKGQSLDPENLLPKESE